jgi:exopolysaccharide production protein ExoY
VLRGEMSLVGPRPCTIFEYEHYLPWHKRRCDTLPGLTGLWQVSGKNKTTFTQMMDLDIYYTERKSLWLDLRILGKTIWVPISQIQDAHAGRAQRKVEAGDIRYERLPKPNPEL